ncbi:MAG: HAD-IB family phosphatase [Candidatus Korobacteraceae bacterium]
MRIGLFLDVDKTLTEGFIQEEYAKALKCQDAYSALEKQYQVKAITSENFGDKLIELFAGQNFTQVEANGHYDDIKLKPDAKELLEQQMQPGFKADVYLVSSGPNYYIDALAARYKIDAKNFCRSVYKFNQRTGLIESCVAIADQDKADFVSKKKEENEYDITIGVGDNAGLDGAFLSQCTIRFMTEQTGTYLHIPKLTSLLTLIQRLSDIAAASGEAGEAHAGKPTEIDVESYIQSLSIGKTLTLLKNKSLPTILGWLAGIFTAGFGAGVVIGKLVGGK